MFAPNSGGLNIKPSIWKVIHFIHLGEKWIGNVSPLLREAKDTAIGDTMYDKGRSCEYLFFSSNVNGFYHCCGWDIDGRQKCPQKI